MPAKKSKLPPDANQKQQLHYSAILLEEIRSQMNAVIETVNLTRNELRQQMQENHQELKGEIEVTQMAIRVVKEDTLRIEKTSLKE